VPRQWDIMQFEYDNRATEFFNTIAPNRAFDRRRGGGLQTAAQLVTEIAANIKSLEMGGRLLLEGSRRRARLPSPVAVSAE
jgi:DNA-directed RNA polymerase specialized sigma24 family protein